MLLTLRNFFIVHIPILSWNGMSVAGGLWLIGAIKTEREILDSVWHTYFTSLLVC